MKAILFAYCSLLVAGLADPAQDLLDKMTFDEKCDMLHGIGTGKPYVGGVIGVPRLAIPDLHLQDGPQGFRCNGISSGFGRCPIGTSTAFPSGLTMGASWDADSVYNWGRQMGEEFFKKGANIQLGPGLAIHRVPEDGRNFEYISGEDPYLGKMLAGPAVKGIQSQGIIANAKHWVFNNQEMYRGVGRAPSFSAEVDERTRFEIYYPPFKGAIDAGVGSMMCSYNKIGGTYSCENNGTLNRDLRERLGFKGFVMTDWGACHSNSILEGLDLEMPAGNSHTFNDTRYFGAVNQSVLRILRAMISVGVKANKININANVSTARSMQVAQDLASNSTVLVKNDGSLLPLDAKSVRRIALIGTDAVDPAVSGRGSGFVTPSYLPTPLQAITDHLAAIGRHDVVNFTSDTGEAQKLAASADVAIVFISIRSGEGGDRKDLSFGPGDELVEQIASVQPNTVVAAVAPGAVMMPWADKVKSIMLPFMPGQMYANALTELLFGLKSPQGRLPVTIPSKGNEMNFTEAQYPGVNISGNIITTYSEGLFVGYRWYDANNVSAHFCFGHGLSYTNFSYSGLQYAGPGQHGRWTVSFTLTNTGKVSGNEVPQLYVGFPSAVGEPPKVLKSFRQVRLEAGKGTRVTFTLDKEDLSIWDTKAHAWTQPKGTFSLMVGASSCDIKLSHQIEVTKFTETFV